MAKKSHQSRELQLLGEKVREAKELIGRLKERNRDLAVEVAELKNQLEGGDSQKGEDKTSSPSRPSKSAQSAQLDLLRRERKEIREKISHLLEKLEQQSNSDSAG